MEKFDFIKPEFLFCEIPIKDGTKQDYRIWIYHLNSLSLIEFINVDDCVDLQFTGKQDRFEYLDENWFGVFVQNNCEVTGHNADLILKNAWKFLENYFDWEEEQEEKDY